LVDPLLSLEQRQTETTVPPPLSKREWERGDIVLPADTFSVPDNREQSEASSRQFQVSRQPGEGSQKRRRYQYVLRNQCASARKYDRSLNRRSIPPPKPEPFLLPNCRANKGFPTPGARQIRSPLDAGAPNR